MGMSRSEASNSTFYVTWDIMFTIRLQERSHVKQPVKERVVISCLNSADAAHHFLLTT
jgi:hypothetical protein